MSATVWNLWPWISMIVFMVLVKMLIRINRNQNFNPMMPYSEERKDNDWVGLMLILSLIIGAAVCILIKYNF